MISSGNGKEEYRANFDSDGNLIVPASAFEGIKIKQPLREIVCIHCGHVMHIKTKRGWVRCRSCKGKMEDR